MFRSVCQDDDLVFDIIKVRTLYSINLIFSIVFIYKDL